MDLFKSKIEELANKYIKTKQSQTNISYHITIKNLIGSIENFTNYTEKKIQAKIYINHYKSVNASFQRKIRQAYWKYIYKIFDFDAIELQNEQTRKSSKQFWSSIKSQKQ